MISGAWEYSEGRKKKKALAGHQEAGSAHRNFPCDSDSLGMGMVQDEACSQQNLTTQTGRFAWSESGRTISGNWGWVGAER
jgi:hypothetical protein